MEPMMPFELSVMLFLQFVPSLFFDLFFLDKLRLFAFIILDTDDSSQVILSQPKFSHSLLEDFPLLL
jgi:hypothetical protein